jgi:hypothetical protein
LVPQNSGRAFARSAASVKVHKMQPYRLVICIDRSGLQQIYTAGMAVAIVKTVVVKPAPAAPLPVAWIILHPLEQNEVAWTDDYGVYATKDAIAVGATITAIADCSAQSGWIYTYAADVFRGSAGGSQDTITVSNEQTKEPVSFGVSQRTNVNGSTALLPLNVTLVPAGRPFSFAPQEIVSIFLTPMRNNGAVLPEVPPNAPIVTLTPESPSVNIGFNDATWAFYEMGAPSSR